MLKNYLGLLVGWTVAAILLAGPGSAAQAGPAADQALQAYHRAIAAPTVGAREEAFEEALALYLARFNEMKEEGRANGWLAYNIGNCYFNLKQLGEAIYYYKLGLKLLPGNEKITDNLNIALAERQNGVDFETGEVLTTLLFFHYRISPAARINLAIVCSTILALLLAGSRLRPRPLWRYTAAGCGLLVFCLFASLGAEYYQPSHEGVIINPADVRVDAGPGFAPITQKPLGAGSGLRVLALADGWYQVRLNDGRQGYIPQQDLKLVL